MLKSIFIDYSSWTVIIRLDPEHRPQRCPRAQSPEVPQSTEAPQTREVPQTPEPRGEVTAVWECSIFVTVENTVLVEIVNPSGITECFIRYRCIFLL